MSGSITLRTRDGIIKCPEYGTKYKEWYLVVEDENVDRHQYGSVKISPTIDRMFDLMVEIYSHEDGNDRTMERNPYAKTMIGKVKKMVVEMEKITRDRDITNVEPTNEYFG